MNMNSSLCILLLTAIVVPTIALNQTEWDTIFDQWKMETNDNPGEILLTKQFSSKSPFGKNKFEIAIDGVTLSQTAMTELQANRDSPQKYWFTVEEIHFIYTSVQLHTEYLGSLDFSTESTKENPLDGGHMLTQHIPDPNTNFNLQQSPKSYRISAAMTVEYPLPTNAEGARFNLFVHHHGEPWFSLRFDVVFPQSKSYSIATLYAIQKENERKASTLREFAQFTFAAASSEKFTERPTTTNSVITNLVQLVKDRRKPFETPTRIGDISKWNQFLRSVLGDNQLARFSFQAESAGYTLDIEALPVDPKPRKGAPIYYFQVNAFKFAMIGTDRDALNKFIGDGHSLQELNETKITELTLEYPIIKEGAKVTEAIFVFGPKQSQDENVHVANYLKAWTTTITMTFSDIGKELENIQMGTVRFREDYVEDQMLAVMAGSDRDIAAETSLPKTPVQVESDEANALTKPEMKH